MGIKHSKTVAVADDTVHPGVVLPSDWNADHVLTGLLALIDGLAVAPNKVFALDASSNPILLSTASFGGVNSPAFTGIPTAPTAALGTNTTQLATMAAVQAAIDALLAGAPGALNTLKELADAINDDASYAATITAALALKAPLASPTFTGAPIVPTVAGSTDSSGKIASTAFVQAVAAAVLAAANTASFSPNVLLNQNFRIDQRNEGASVGLTTTLQFISDRWLSAASASSQYTAQRYLTGGPAAGIPSFLRLQRTAGSANTVPVPLMQVLESSTVAELTGQNVVLSFWARVGANWSSTYLLVDIRTGTVADEGRSGVYAGTWIGLATPISTGKMPTTGWARYQVMASIPSNALELAVMFTMTGVGTAGAADYVDITGAKLELGTIATNVEVLPYGENLRRCQRYYEKTFSQGTAPAQNNAGAGGTIGVAASSASANANSVSWNFKVTKRVNNPTIVTFNPYAAGTGFSVSGSGNLAADVMAQNDTAAVLRVVGTPAVGNSLTINATADAEL